jgi:uncharacterized protein (TIGR03382 family)
MLLAAILATALTLVGSTAFGIIAADPVGLCNDSGGTWNDCGSGCGPFTCYNLPEPNAICPAVCVAQCDCPAGTVFDYGVGCMDLDECGGGDPPPPKEDWDGDGQSLLEGDCNDDDPTVYAGAEELCDDKDNNCDGVIDEGCEEPVVDPEDKDGDGYLDDVDCNDNNATSYPGAEELCDFEDNNCDGVVDEGCGDDPDPEPSAFEKLCTDTGGAYSCMATPCADGEDCACADQCTCADGMAWTDDAGCADSEIPECEDGYQWDGTECVEIPVSQLELCESTGGTDYDAFPGCGPYSCEEALVAVPQMECPEDSFYAGCICAGGMYFHAEDGCVDAAACDGGDDPVDPADPADTTGGDDTGASDDADASGGGGGGGGGGGCQAGTSPSDGGFLLLLLALAALALSARRRPVSLPDPRLGDR